MLNQSPEPATELTTYSESHMSKDHYQVVVMGAARVGKTAIVHQFLYKVFVANYKATIEQLHRRECLAVGGNHHLTVDILDTSGAYQFPAMRELSIARADAFILVYAVNDAESFEEVRKQRELILKNRSNMMVATAAGTKPIIVVGNKCDIDATERAVSRETAESLVCIDWENDFVETSAKYNVNVDTIFTTLFPRIDFQFGHRPSSRRRSRLSLPQVFGHSGTNKFKQLKRHSCVIS